MGKKNKRKMGGGKASGEMAKEETAKNEKYEKNNEKRYDDDDDDDNAGLGIASAKGSGMNGKNENGEYGSSDEEGTSSEEEGDDLILEGVLIRNQEVPSSDDDDDDDEDSDDDVEDSDDDDVEDSDDDDDEDSDDDDDENEPKKKRAKMDMSNKDNKSKSKSKSKPKSKNEGEPEIINVEFTFNDMSEKYFHGLKTHLLTNPIYAPHSSALSDLMIENVSVGTVASTGEDHVFGFASVLSLGCKSSARSDPCMESILKDCKAGCPEERKQEMETVVSGSTRRPAGLFLHGRMVNLPLEITLVLHEQLVLDMDWAVENASGGEEERKSLDFGAFLLLAPCSSSSSSMDSSRLEYKNFEDEVFANSAEFVYTIRPKRSLRDDECTHVAVIVLTKTGHRKAMAELKQLINGS